MGARGPRPKQEASFTSFDEPIAGENGRVAIVAPAVGGVRLNDGHTQPADQLLRDAPSALYDAIAVLPSAGGAEALCDDPAARALVSDSFNHAKFIDVGPDATALISAADLPDDACPCVGTAQQAQSFVASLKALRFWRRSATGH